MNTMLPQRFWDKVDMGDDCWVWTGAVDLGGYGRFFLSGRLHAAHRLSYEDAVGAIPAGLVTDHPCRVRRCVNPAHLEPVPQRINVLRGDAMRNGAWQRDKTHCKNGHEFTEENTYIRPSGHRACRRCRLASVLRYQERKRRAVAIAQA